MTQLALQLAPTGPRTCGNCVCLNGMDEARGYCTIGGWRQRDQEPCERWFGKEQLELALYGKRRKE